MYCHPPITMVLYANDSMYFMMMKIVKEYTGMVYFLLIPHLSQSPLIYTTTRPPFPILSLSCERDLEVPSSLLFLNSDLSSPLKIASNISSSIPVIWEDNSSNSWTYAIIDHVCCNAAKTSFGVHIWELPNLLSNLSFNNNHLQKGTCLSFQLNQLNTGPPNS